MTVARHLRIHGRVQGVWYRDWAVDTGRRLAVAGWIRNRHDGTVEAVVQGDERAVEQFVRLAREGPPGAEVTRVETRPLEPDEGLTGFTQAPTA